MPYTFKEPADLKALVDDLKAKALRGEGLADEEIQMDLYTISRMLKKTADSITPAKNAKELNEFKLDLEETAKSLDKLRNPQILQDPFAFEMALRDLVNLKDLMFKRTPNGHLYYTIIDQYGNPEDADFRTYGKDLFFAAYKGINDALNTGMPYLKEEVDEALKPENTQKYLQQKEVINLQNDKESQMIASMLDQSGELYKSLETFIDTHHSPAIFSQYESEEEYTLYGGEFGSYIYAKALKNTLDELNETGNVAEKRELFLQARSCFRSLQQTAKMHGVKEDSFPLNIKYDDPMKLDIGKRFLISVFDEKSPRVIEQVKHRKSPVLFELPKGVSAQMAVAHLATEDTDDKKMTAKIVSDYNLMLTLLPVIKGEAYREGADPTIQEGFKKLVGSGQAMMKKVHKLRKDLKNQEKLNAAADDLNRFFKDFNQFVKDNENNPELMDRVRDLLSPVIAKFRKMNFEAGLQKFKTDEEKALLHRPAEKYKPEDYEIDSERDALISSSLYMSKSEAYTAGAMMFQKIEELAKADNRNGSLANSLENLVHPIDDICYFRPPYTNNNKINGHNEMTTLRQIENKMRQITESLKSKQPRYFGDEIYKLRDQCYEESRNENRSNLFRKVNLKIYKALDSYVERAFKASANPIKAYIGANLTRDNGMELAAAAYLYQHEQILKNPTKIPKYNKSEIEKRAKQIKGSELFKTLFVPSEKELETARKYEEKYGRVLDEEKFLKNYANRKRNYYNNASKLPELVGVIENPFAFDTTPDLQKNALLKLRELGQTLDSCSFWSSSAYKKYFAAMKDLGRKDFDNMTSEEMGVLLNDIYKKAEKFMNGRMANRKKPEQREHFEQTLDTMSILSGVGRYGSVLADEQVKKTNTIRERLHQPTVSLKNRTIDKTKQRLDDLRGRVGYERTDQSLDDLFKNVGTLSKDFPAYRYTYAEQIRDLPKNVKDVKPVDDLMNEIKQKVTEKENDKHDFKFAKEVVASSLALTAITAYKAKNGENVVNLKEYNYAKDLFMKHSMTSKVAETYSDTNELKNLFNVQNPEEKPFDTIDTLNSKFHEGRAEVKKKMDQLDENLLGDAYKLTDLQLANKFHRRYQQRKVDEILKKNDIKKFKTFDEFDKELEEMDINKFNENDELMMDNLQVNRKNLNTKIIKEINDKRQDELIKTEGPKDLDIKKIGK